MEEQNFPQEQPKDDEIKALEKALKKAKKIEEERKEVLNNAASGYIHDDRSRVAFILNHSVEARNSDKELVWLYWETFEKVRFGGESITRESYKMLTSPNSISRIRAKIQNEYKLFQANDKVKRFRGVLEVEKKLQVIEDKPIYLPFYNVFIDETGKTQQYLSVGSLWLNDAREKAGASVRLEEWKKIRNIDFEFHFKDVTPHRLDQYKAFFLEFVTLHASAGFKVIVIKNKGLHKTAITDLTFHLLNNGIQHENQSGRAPLPRLLQVYMDADDESNDSMKIVNIKERLTSQRIEGLEIGLLEAVSSNASPYLQVVDLFIASVNRKLHEEKRNHKDELADYILRLLNFDVSSVDRQNSDVDNAIVFNLGFKQE
ncbi:MAG TPA: DUF3800 domain-containing protein [Saprospiraceae bacterium]|nr:DUF3800 domain-containing protein [Saprospiraceae bacterium]